jgi:hypothetical protein
MRLWMAALGGLAIGALAGLVWFLSILILPSKVPDNVDGGAGLSVVLLFIAAVFVTVGAVVGCLIGSFLGAIYIVATGNKSSEYSHERRTQKPLKKYQPFDDDLG